MTEATAEKKEMFYGEFGGQYVPAEIQAALDEIAEEFEKVKDDPDFNAELDQLLRDYSGRSTPLYFAESLTKRLGGAKVYLKREDLNHLGAHKINNALGQVLIAKRIGKKRIIAETGAGQHRVAAAAVASRFGMKCTIYMGAKDCERQRLNVFRMRLMGLKSRPSLPAPRFWKMQLPQPSKTWPKTWTLLSTWSVQPLVHTHTRKWSNVSKGSSVKKQDNNSWTRSAACQMPSSPAWEAAPTLSGPLMNSSPTKKSA